jgi:hypothetical protein
MGLQRKLASLLKCLKSKWKSREQKLLENLQSRGEGVGSSGIHQVSLQYLVVGSSGTHRVMAKTQIFVKKHTHPGFDWV